MERLYPWVWMFHAAGELFGNSPASSRRVPSDARAEGPRLFKESGTCARSRGQIHKSFTIVSRGRNVRSLALLFLGSDPINVAVPVGQRTEEEHVQPN
jgi:hypothetical protein